MTTTILKSIKNAVTSPLMGALMSALPVMSPSVKHETDIGESFDFTPKYAQILGSKMHYVDEGQGRAVVLVHGNPTSSYLWRNIIPTLAKTHRVIAPDLIGMGKSDKPDLEYTLQDHIRYFTALMKELDLRDATFVLHDWGGALGVEFARKNPDVVRDIVMAEATTKPFYWKDEDAMTKMIFAELRHPEKGHKLIAGKNYFIEGMLPMLTGRKLTDTEMAAYRAPYPSVTERKPLYVWPQEIPFDETPKRNHDVLSENYEYLKNSDIPLLFIHADPGVIYTKAIIEGIRADISRAQFTSIGPGMHFIQETAPKKLSQILLDWVSGS